jgi:DNA invertase Pin-like site-specific DNA recombinase
MEKAGIYVRISSDVVGEGLGVARQETACRELVDRNGWGVSDVYVDNDVSAFSGKTRPAYLRMLEDIESGRIDGVIAWHGDRLHRSPRELESFIDLIEATGCQVQTVQSGQIDLSTPTGRLNARVVGAFARYESEHKSKRIRAKLEQNALAGKHHGGSRPYGWEDDRVTLRPDEAAFVRTATDLVIAGNSVKAVVRAVSAAGAVNSLGRPWRDITVRDMLLRPRNAGLRQHKGVIVGQGQWEPILDRDVWEKVRVILTDPTRRSTPGASGRKHLLSAGIARCAVCDGPLGVAPGKSYKGKSRKIYRCTAASHVSRDVIYLDAFVRDVVCARLAKPDAVGLLQTREERPRVTKAKAELEALRSRLDVAAADYADGAITAQQMRTVTARLRPKIAAAEKMIPVQVPEVQALEKLIGAADIVGVWDGLDVSVRRQVVDALMSVVVHRAPPGRGGFNPDCVEIRWKS